METVRETICTSCVHLNVCRYKSELLETVKRLDDIIPVDNDRFSYVLNCKDYSIKPYSTIRYITNSTNSTNTTNTDYVSMKGELNDQN